MNQDRSSGPYGPQSTSVAWAAIALAVCAMMLPALLRPMMLHDSFWISHVWASQFTAQLGEGVIYPRWLPLSHEGLGSPVFYYYPPLAFYATGAFGLVGFPTYPAILATFALAFFVSGIGAFYWLRGRSEYPLAGALFFTVAPYHAFDFYLRGALAESVAIALLPLLAIGLRRTSEGKGWAAAAIAYAALILAHVPLALLVSLFLIAPYALIHRGQIAGFTLSCAVGIGLAAIYLLPAIGLEPFRDTARLWATAFLRPDFWTLPATNWHVPMVIYFHLTVAVLAIPALVLAVWSHSRPAIYAVAILAISLGLVPFLWSLPLIRDIQFPYRILPLAELGLAAAFAARGPFGNATRVAAMALPLVWAAVLTQAPRANAPDRAAVEKRYIDLTENLPPGAKTGKSPRHWYENPREGRIPPPKVEGWVVEPVFYFPAWSCGQVEPNTKLLMHRPDCAPRIRATGYEKLGGLVSLAALLFLLVQLGRKRLRKG
jgi:uncharacterized membrane protein